MGSWSHEPFGNDTACDWAYDLEGSKGLAFIEDALDQVLRVGTDYLEAPEAEAGIAAVEVTAKLLGKGTQSDSYTEVVDAWVAGNQITPTYVIRQKAAQVIDRVLGEESELAELWSETEENAAWQRNLHRLREICTG